MLLGLSHSFYISGSTTPLKIKVLAEARNQYQCRRHLWVTVSVVALLVLALGTIDAA
jgi:hypothetical protein